MRQIAAGSTDLSFYFELRDAVTGGPYETTGGETSFNLIYQRDGEAQQENDCPAALGSATAAHADNNVFHCGNGTWRTDWPDAAFAAGSAGVTLKLTHDSESFVAIPKQFSIDDVYHADIRLTRDSTNSRDEYTVTWFRNGVPVTSGITTPLIQVVKRADGTDLVAETAMTQIGSTGSYKYDEASDRMTVGEAVVAICTATIDGSARSWRRVCTRDSA